MCNLLERLLFLCLHICSLFQNLFFFLSFIFRKNKKNNRAQDIAVIFKLDCCSVFVDALWALFSLRCPASSTIKLLFSPHFFAASSSHMTLDMYLWKQFILLLFSSIQVPSNIQLFFGLISFFTFKKKYFHIRADFCYTTWRHGKASISSVMSSYCPFCLTVRKSNPKSEDVRKHKTGRSCKSFHLRAFKSNYRLPANGYTCFYYCENSSFWVLPFHL